MTKATNVLSVVKCPTKTQGILRNKGCKDTLKPTWKDYPSHVQFVKRNSGPLVLYQVIKVFIIDKWIFTGLEFS